MPRRKRIDHHRVDWLIILGATALVLGAVALGASGCRHETGAAPRVGQSLERAEQRTESIADRAAGGEAHDPHGASTPPPDPARADAVQKMRTRVERLARRLKGVSGKVRHQASSASEKLRRSWETMLSRLEKKLVGARRLMDRLEKAPEEERATTEEKLAQVLDALEEAFRAAEMNLEL